MTQELPLTHTERRLTLAFKETLESLQAVLAATIGLVDVAHTDLLNGKPDDAMARLGELLSQPQLSPLLARAALQRMTTRGTMQ